MSTVCAALPIQVLMLRILIYFVVLSFSTPAGRQSEQYNVRLTGGYRGRSGTLEVCGVSMRLGAAVFQEMGIHICSEGGVGWGVCERACGDAG